MTFFNVPYALICWTSLCLYHVDIWCVLIVSRKQRCRPLHLTAQFAKFSLIQKNSDLYSLGVMKVKIHVLTWFKRFVKYSTKNSIMNKISSTSGAYNSTWDLAAYCLVSRWILVTWVNKDLIFSKYLVDVCSAENNHKECSRRRKK